MELPLDHFRLIGVSPSASSEEILRAFQLRLDKTPDEGFTFDVLTQRSELLRRTADLLTNAESRKEYEDLILNGASGLDLSSNKEVAGLILLWEAGLAKEAFNFARKALQPPQTPALGSGRESDLTLLIALSSRDVALQEQDNRRYASAAEFLQEGIHILQRMGKLTELRRMLEDDLSTLLPYRILDYLSRDIKDNESHQKGIKMLENLIVKRGGLEGKNTSEYDKFLNQNEFEVFFQQIRSFLTAQEQVDLFISLQKRGSLEAGFFAFLSLTAIGFNQRKPEKLFEAKKILKNLNLFSLDSMPLMGCLDLLLADIKNAEAKFSGTSDEKLKVWFLDYPNGSLEAMCSYCTNWLENEVLNGFRDIQVNKVDLNSWFEDQEIQEFIEKVEKKSIMKLSKTNFQRFGQNIKQFKNQDFNSNLDKNDDYYDESKLPFPGGEKKVDGDLKEQSISIEEILINKSLKIYEYVLEKYEELKLEFIYFLKENNGSYKLYLYPFLLLFVFGLALSFLRNNKNAENIKLDTSIVKNEIENQNFKKVNKNIEIPANNNILVSVPKKEIDFEVKELTTASPSLEQIKYLINTWYFKKSNFLKGKEELEISKIVKQGLISRLQEERRIDIQNNIFKNIETEIQNIKLISQTSSRISVEVSLIYKEKILRKNGELINETIYPLKVRYILGFGNRKWKLVDYVSGV